MGGSNIRSSRRRRGAVGAFIIGSLVVLVALVCTGENGDAFGRKQRRLKTKAQAAVGQPRPTTRRKMADNTKTKTTHNTNTNENHAASSTVAVHEWKTNHASDTTARALKNNHCPPGVDSVTGSFCGLSYEQICCFCPQPADCEAGCHADGDGVVRDECFHHITIPCPDVDCDVDEMIADYNEHERPVELSDR